MGLDGCKAHESSVFLNMEIDAICNHLRPHSSLDDVLPVLIDKQFYQSQSSRII